MFLDVNCAVGIGGRRGEQKGQGRSTIETEDKTTSDFLFGGWKGSHS